MNYEYHTDTYIFNEMQYLMYPDVEKIILDKINKRIADGWHIHAILQLPTYKSPHAITFIRANI